MSPGEKTRDAYKINLPNPPLYIGEYHFFGIGINEYLNFPPLNNAVKDIRDVTRLLIRYYQFEEENVTCLFDKDATKSKIIEQLETYVSKLGNKDSLLIYFSGHGHLNTNTNRGYWIPTEAKQGDISNYITNAVIKEYIKDIPAFHILLISDACFSGSLFVKGKTRAIHTIDELEQRRSRWAFCSGRHDELVYDGPVGENSPFTSGILQVLSNNIRSINIWKIIDEVTDLTRAKYRQLPEGNPLFDAGHEGGQFIFRPKGEIEERPTIEEKEVFAPKTLSTVTDQGNYSSKSGRIKRPLWQWVGLIIIAVGLLGGGAQVAGYNLVNWSSGKDVDSFYLTVFVHGKNGKDDRILENQGSVSLDLGPARIEASINKKGEATFKELPIGYLGRKALLSIKHPQPYFPINRDSSYLLEEGQPIYLEVELKGINKIRGDIIDFDTEQPLDSVRVSYQDIATFTNQYGYFELDIPPEKQAKFIRVNFFKPGYKMKIIDSIAPHTQQQLGLSLEKQ